MVRCSFLPELGFVGRSCYAGGGGQKEKEYYYYYFADVRRIEGRRGGGGGGYISTPILPQEKILGAKEGLCKGQGSS